MSSYDVFLVSSFSAQLSWVSKTGQSKRWLCSSGAPHLTRQERSLWYIEENLAFTPLVMELIMLKSLETIEFVNLGSFMYGYILNFSFSMCFVVLCFFLQTFKLIQWYIYYFGLSVRFKHTFGFSFFLLHQGSLQSFFLCQPSPVLQSLL